MGSTRRTCRVVSRRDEPSGIWALLNFVHLSCMPAGRESNGVRVASKILWTGNWERAARPTARVPEAETRWVMHLMLYVAMKPHCMSHAPSYLATPPATYPNLALSPTPAWEDCAWHSYASRQSEAHHLWRLFAILRHRNTLAHLTEPRLCNIARNNWMLSWHSYAFRQSDAHHSRRRHSLQCSWNSSKQSATAFQLANSDSRWRCTSIWTLGSQCCVNCVHFAV